MRAKTCNFLLIHDFTANHFPSATSFPGRTLALYPVNRQVSGVDGEEQDLIKESVGEDVLFCALHAVESSIPP